MNTILTIDEAEAKELFPILQERVEHCAYLRRPLKEWPLYDKIAEYLDRPSSLEHYEYIREMEEECDEWHARRFGGGGDDD